MSNGYTGADSHLLTGDLHRPSLKGTQAANRTRPYDLGVICTWNDEKYRKGSLGLTHSLKCQTELAGPPWVGHGWEAVAV